jgi:AraC-like DNA-binding protein
MKLLFVHYVKIILEQKMFYGLCKYGLFEVCLPIVQNGKTLAVIYVGNIVCDIEQSKAKAKKACRQTGVDFVELQKEFDNAYKGQKIEAYINIAKAVESYIKLVLKTSDFRLDYTEHWIVKELKTYAKGNYRRTILLKDVATLYGFNEKYLGRLFLKETGVSFTAYVNSLRLEQAEAELKAGEKSILDISLDAGFENVTYFNRLFKQKHGITPRQFRA